MSELQEMKTYHEIKSEVRALVMDSLPPEKEYADEEILRIIDRCIRQKSMETYMTVSAKMLLKRELFNGIRRLDLLQDLLDNPDITEIMVNGSGAIFYEMNGQIYPWEKHFESEEKLADVIQQIVSRSNRQVNEASPIVDARLADGSRVNVVLKPVAIDGPILTIRKFTEDAGTVKKLIQWGSLTPQAAGFLKVLVKAGYNIFISGSTGSGKTTLLNALAGLIPPDERVITIEDSAELQIRGIPNLVRLEVRNADADGENGVTIRDLIRTSLRMRPNRIIVGEIRGAEAVDMLQAMNTGHDGSLSTGHANSVADMMSRLETMVLMGSVIPLAAIRQQIASAIDIVVHLGRLRDKSRKVLEIVEISGLQDGMFVFNPLFRFCEETFVREAPADSEASAAARVSGSLKTTGRKLKNTAKLQAAGFDPERVMEGW